MKRRELLKITLSPILFAAISFSDNTAALESVENKNQNALDRKPQATSNRKYIRMAVFNKTTETILVRVSNPSEDNRVIPKITNIYSQEEFQRRVPLEYLVEFLTLKDETNTHQIRYDFVSGFRSEIYRSIEFSKDADTPEEFLITEKIGVKNISQ